MQQVKTLPGRWVDRYTASVVSRGVVLVMIAVGALTMAVGIEVAPFAPWASLLMHLALVVFTVALTARALAVPPVSALDPFTEVAGRESAPDVARDVAHDLRGPLASVAATLELLADDGFGDLPVEAREAARRAASTSMRACEVVDRTLRTAEDAAIAPRPACATSLDGVLDQVVAALDVQVRASGARITIDESLRGLPAVHGDPADLFRVFANLLQNSLKYHRVGNAPSVEISASMDELAGTGRGATIAFHDDGVGIPVQARAHVFDAGYRVPDAVMLADGDGRGLATTARLMSALGGRIWVGDAPRGTTMYLRFPMPHPAQPAPRTSVPAAGVLTAG